MVVHVAIAPAHPLLVIHGPEHGMRRPCKWSWLLGEPLEERVKLREVAREVDWPRAADLDRIRVKLECRAAIGAEPTRLQRA